MLKSGCLKIAKMGVAMLEIYTSWLESCKHWGWGDGQVV